METPHVEEWDLDPSEVVPDEPILSPRRIWAGICWWAWYVTVCEGNPDKVRLWNLARYFHRPNEQHEKGVY